MDRDTIVALGTPAGESALAVVRVSGPAAIDIVEGLAPGTRDAATHALVLRTLRDSDGAPIDEALVAVMRAPASYTGENLVEISCHGGTQAASDLIEAIMARGARLAARGEFTQRAFLSGKMDLAEAEAVAELIASETKLQRRVALEQLAGGLSRRVGECEALLLEELALVEASIDFCEEEIPPRAPAETLRVVRETKARIERLLESELAGAKLRRGIRVTIVGPRNAGKSSIYNALLGEERAIVSPIPGTTRDRLCERIHLRGFTCYLEDTAGMAETRCEIEARGITLGREAAGRADLVLFTLDGNAELDANAVEEAKRFENGKLLLVINKSDLGLRHEPAYIMEQLDVDEIVVVSAQTGAGLEDLRRRIYERTVGGEAGAIDAERLAVNARQAGSLREAKEALERLESLTADDAPSELVSAELRAGADALGAVTGRTTPADVLEIIFSRFCIGK